MFGLYFSLSDVTSFFDVHLIFERGKVAGCFTARERRRRRRRRGEGEEEDVKISLLNKRATRSVKNFTDLCVVQLMSCYGYTLES
jgi:hypothetical protein